MFGFSPLGMTVLGAMGLVGVEPPEELPPPSPIDVTKISPSRVVVFEGSGSRFTPFGGSGSRLTPFEGSGSRVAPFEDEDN